MAQTLDEWRGEGRFRCSSSLYVGTCDSDQEFVFNGMPLELEVRFFDAERRFTAFAIQTDLQDRCGGAYFWPELVECKAPTITRVECGDPKLKGWTMLLPGRNLSR